MRGKILAVDDEPDQLELVGMLLRDEGFDVDTCQDGSEALEKLRKSRPDLILVDVSMPKMNGFTLCEAIRKNAATAAIPIIMLTGLHTHFARLNGLAHGANAFLLKPFVAEELMVKIRELLPASSGAAGS
ncbi:MAG: response regulator [Verrucomicrobiota bacterium]|jgi:DNA-binding response OmpR family regulator